MSGLTHSAAALARPDDAHGSDRRTADGIVLEMRGITKAFPGVLALDKMHLKVREGTVHVLVGENGAGKSTLMKILSGVYAIDTGEVYFKGEQLDHQDTAAALGRGISMIHQELSPVLDMTIAENIFLGREPAIAEKAFFRALSISRR
nr:ATP-binding cassette domain-containing protein [Agrobacterium vitis]